MKRITALLFAMGSLHLASAQYSGTDKVEKTIQKADRAVGKAQNVISIFQPYLLKAQLLYTQGRQMVHDAKASAGSLRNGQSTATPSYMPDPANINNDVYIPAYDPSVAGSSGAGSPYPADAASGSHSSPVYPSGSSTTPTPPAYSAAATPEIYLPINNEASINNDGSGNWGNQNNGLYGNCLDALTGTVMSMAEAADRPGSVDLLFFAPTDGNGNYVLMTPNFARTNGTATYMSEHASDPVRSWTDVVESEVGISALTIGQFNKIQNNSQIRSAVMNTKMMQGYQTIVGHKLDGMVIAVKSQMENRELYTLIAVDRHQGTSGSNGFLKIRIKTQGVDGNQNGRPDANYYIR